MATRTWRTIGARGRRGYLPVSVIVAILLLFVPSTPAGEVLPISADALKSLLHESDGDRVVVFMAAWCAPCVEELPTLNRLYGTYRPQGLSVIGIALDPGGPEAMQPIIDRLKVQFPVYWAGDSAAMTYRISRIPLMLLIRNGEEKMRVVGGRSPKQIEKTFKRFME